MICRAGTAHDLFDGAPRRDSDRRSARRTFRSLLMAVHPDRSAADGVDSSATTAAAARLSELYADWQRGAAPAAEAHVVGHHGTYPLRNRLWANERVACYETGKPGERVDIDRTDGGRCSSALRELWLEAAVHGMSAFLPGSSDCGVTDGRSWVQYQIPDGMVSLREVHEAYPDGLDGRDWAWMLRRILMTLAAAGRPHGALSVDTVLIRPEQHGVVLTGWTAAIGGDGPVLAGLTDTMLRSREPRQSRFMHAAQELSPGKQLTEYDLLLQHLYGRRRFRPFTVSTGTNN
ncbi:hypothetical protein GOAMR_59_00920 [Gordonia amarae NBRC 15530]|uniref:Protein kinase domain-containing protein n=2 Tax=Gordonia amarae TaxID=36821 RepID=G7GT66_9ACTN|nr:hypothetical protein GOAMR_59_00920 [Gordonia amarae NBRC 15530]